MALWDRSPVEDDEAFLWFAAYRDAVPPRQLSRLRVSVPGKVAPEMQKLLSWLKEYNWRERAAAWDAHLDALKQAEKEDIARVSARDHALADQALLNEARELAARELDKLLLTSMSSETESLKPSEVRHLLDMVVKLGRLVRGESTENVGVTYDTSALTDAEKKDLIRLRAKIRKNQ